MPLGATEDARPRYGQEASARAWRIARQRFLLSGTDAEIRLGDSLVSDAFPDLRVQAVICDPPYGAKNPIAAAALAEGRWESCGGARQGRRLCMARVRSAAPRRGWPSIRASSRRHARPRWDGGVDTSRDDPTRRSRSGGLAPARIIWGTSVEVALWILRPGGDTANPQPVLPSTCPPTALIPRQKRRLAPSP